LSLKQSVGWQPFVIELDVLHDFARRGDVRASWCDTKLLRQIHLT